MDVCLDYSSLPNPLCINEVFARGVEKASGSDPVSDEGCLFLF